MAHLDDHLDALESLTRSELCDRWAKLTGRPAPNVSRAMLQLALAYELQAKTSGGLPRKVKQRLDQLATAKSTTQDVQPGMRLAREFGGKMHLVTIGDEGQVLWNDREWGSLSVVARAITGTRWSGPAFFGLKQKRKAA